MNFTKATNEQLKNIIESDVGVPTPLLKQAYEEAIKRKVLDGKVKSHILVFFKNEKNAERLTGLLYEDLFWICYELGYESMDRYKPTSPFGAYWYTVIVRNLKNIARDYNAQKRTGDIYSLEDTHAWRIPGENRTEPMALQKVYFDSLLNQLTDAEKEIVIMRYQGYRLHEIGRKQGLTKNGIQKRIKVFQKRLKGA